MVTPAADDADLKPEVNTRRAAADWTGRPFLRRMLVGLAVDVPIVVIVALLTHHNWTWVILFGLVLPVLNWLGLVYQGWFGKRLGVDKPPPPLTWDEKPRSGWRHRNGTYRS